MITVGSDWLLDVFVPGVPAPQGSKKSYGRGRMVEASKAVGPWRERITYQVLQARPTPVEREVAVRLVLHFVMKRPASTPKRVTPHAIRQPDLDKLIRAVGDALTGVAFADDAQVVSIDAFKRIAKIDESPGVHICVARA